MKPYFVNVEDVAVFSEQEVRKEKLSNDKENTGRNLFEISTKPASIGLWLSSIRWTLHIKELRRKL